MQVGLFLLVKIIKKILARTVRIVYIGTVRSLKIGGILSGLAEGWIRVLTSIFRCMGK